MREEYYKIEEEIERLGNRSEEILSTYNYILLISNLEKLEGFLSTSDIRNLDKDWIVYPRYGKPSNLEDYYLHGNNLEELFRFCYSNYIFIEEYNDNFLFKDNEGLLYKYYIELYGNVCAIINKDIEESIKDSLIELMISKNYKLVEQL